MGEAREYMKTWPPNPEKLPDGLYVYKLPGSGGFQRVWV